MIVILLMIIFFMGYIILFLYGAFKQKCVQFDKMKRNCLMLCKWMNITRTGDAALASLLQEKGYDEIIIYGWGYLGEQLFKDLQSTQIKIKGILDRKSIKNEYNIPVYSLQSELPQVDAIIITVLYDGEKIRNDLGKIIKCPTMSLEELI